MEGSQMRKFAKMAAVAAEAMGRGARSGRSALAEAARELDWALKWNWGAQEGRGAAFGDEENRSAERIWMRNGTGEIRRVPRAG